MDELADRVVIVLCRPEESGNIGSVCRAMKTMGITRLRIVGAAVYDARQVGYMSVHAYDVYERSERMGSLREALADTVFSAGVTRRRGAKRKVVSLLPEELAEQIAPIRAGFVGIVFGNERDGLTDEELAECAIAVHIPSSPQFPSLNLSHAVQIVSYALFTARSRPARFTPVPRSRIESLTDSIVGSLRRIGFFSVAGSSLLTTFLHEILPRAALSKSEADRLERIFQKVENLRTRKH